MNVSRNSLVVACVIAAGTCAGAAQADTVYNTSLANLNGQYGAGTATTTTTASGTRTTVVGPGGDANRAYAPVVYNQWEQSAVGGGATVGITTTYPTNGNGSASFSTVSADSKADLEYYFSGGPVALSSLGTMSFSFYRDASSTADAALTPVMRLDMLKDGSYAGALIFENVYQTQAAAPVGTWTTLSATLTSGIFWTSNAKLGPTFANAIGGQKTLQQWIDDNSGSTLSVFGMSIGVGSGWSGTFSGAVDNVNLSFRNGPTVSTNFEVAAAAVPEPATWAMLVTGFFATGATMRRRKLVILTRTV